MNYDTIRAIIIENMESGRNKYDNLSNDEIAYYNHVAMFGKENEKADVSEEEMSIWTD